MSKSCKICHAKTQELDSTGRCSSCTAALTASKQGVSYGQLMARRHEKVLFPPKVEKVEIVVDPSDPSWHSCDFCGKPFRSNIPNQRFCCVPCRVDGHRVEARERARQKAGKPKERICAVCGHPIPEDSHMGLKTCGPQCREIYRREQRRLKSARHRAKVAAQSKEEKHAKN